MKITSLINRFAGRSNAVRRPAPAVRRPYEESITIVYNPTYQGTRNQHLSAYLSSCGIRLNRTEEKLLAALDFSAMSRVFSRRQFAVLTSLFLKPRSSPEPKIALELILDQLGVRTAEVDSIEMSYLASGDNKSVYRFDARSEDKSRRSFVVSLDNVTRWFGQKHSLLEYRFLSKVREKGLELDCLPRLLGFTVVKGTIGEEHKRYYLIFKEYIEGETARLLLSRLDEKLRQKVVYQIGWQLARFISAFKGYPNDLHYANIIVQAKDPDAIRVTFNDIPGIIRNKRNAALSLFADFMIADVCEDALSFMRGFADSLGGKAGLRLLDRYFYFMLTHPLVLTGEDREAISSYLEFKDDYLKARTPS